MTSNIWGECAHEARKSTWAVLTGGRRGFLIHLVWAILTIIVLWRLLGAEAAVPELPALLGSLTAFALLWGGVFAYSFVRSVSQHVGDKDTTIAELKAALTNSRKQTTPADWKDLGARFSAPADDTVRADFFEGEGLTVRWVVTGGFPQANRQFEAVARIAGTKVLMSEYCRASLDAKVMAMTNPIDVWLETIRSLTGRCEFCGYTSVGGEGVSARFERISQVARESYLLCLDLESKEVG